MESGDDSHSRVDPSMSLNRNVTVPAGNSAISPTLTKRSYPLLVQFQKLRSGSSALPQHPRSSPWCRPERH